jgi:prepilin-type processing-associated H-X9-DG protein
LYAGANKQSFPYGFWAGSNDGLSEDYARMWDWTTKLQGMLAKQPDSRQEADAQALWKAKARQVFTCPKAPAGVAQPHYLPHPRLLPDSRFADPFHNTSPPTRLPPYKVGRQKRGTEIIVLFDAAQPIGADPDGLGYVVGMSIDNYRFWYGERSLIRPIRSWDWEISQSDPIVAGANTDSADNDQNMRFRHGRNDSLNALFLDGHVGAFKISKNVAGATGAGRPTYFAADLLRGNVRVDKP